MPYAFRDRAQAQVMEVPNKTFLYMASGRPIVVTDMPNLKFVEPGLIYRSQGHEQFLRNCLRSVHEDTEEFVRRRMSVASANLWANKKSRIIRLLCGEVDG
jgi:hypothetical protein